MSKSELEEELLAQFKEKGWSVKRNVTFHPFRRWKADFVFHQKKIIIEVEGGTWAGGRHTTGVGFEKDCEKYNAAEAMGYHVYRFTSTMIKCGYAIAFIERLRNGDDAGALRLKDFRRRKRNNRNLPGIRRKRKKQVQQVKA